MLQIGGHTAGWKVTPAGLCSVTIILRANSVFQVLSILTHLILLSTPRGRYYYPILQMRRLRHKEVT